MNKEGITAACAFIFDAKGDILAIKNHRGWDIPGGKVEKNEELHQTVIREVLEEASVVVENPKLFYIQEFETLGWKIAYYRCDLVRIDPFIKEHETTDRYFMSITKFLSVYGGDDVKETEDLIKKALELNE